MRKRTRFALRGAFTVVVAALAVAAAGNGGGGGSNLPTKIGPGEGALTLIAWEGYTQPQWVRPFEKQTGCRVSVKYGGSSDEMVTLMRQGGGGQYDMVSASGDASLRLIAGGDVQPVNTSLIPNYADVFEGLKKKPWNSVKG